MKVHFGDAAAAQKQIVFVDGKFIFLMLKVWDSASKHNFQELWS